MFRTINVGKGGGEVQVEYRMNEAEFVIQSIHCISKVDLFPKQGLRFSVYSGDVVKLDTIGGSFVDQGFMLSLKDAILEQLRETVL